MQGTFLEAADDSHIALREALLSNAWLPALELPVLSAASTTFQHTGWPHARAMLDAQGLCPIQLDHPLEMDAFEALAHRLGQPVLEADPQVQPHVERGVFLHLRTSFGPTCLVALQPFSASFLTMHTESSGHVLADQPRYIALQCLEPGDSDDAPQTVLAPMQAVVERLSASAVEVLGRTRYHGSRHSPYILRRDGQRWVLSFRDFHRQSLAWIHDGPASSDAVQAALRELLAAMYAVQRACAVRWTRGLLLLLDNQRWMHARSEGRFRSGHIGRHLLRVRIRADTALPDKDEPTSLSTTAANLSVLSTPRLFSRPFGPLPPLQSIKDFASVFDSAAEPTESMAPTECFVDDRVLEVFARACDPEDASELHRLWLGRLEAELGPKALKPELALAWRASRVHRTAHNEDVLTSQATVGLVKALFNTYFRDELYGALSAQRQIVLSSGAVDEQTHGLPEVLKETLRYALERNWYGYSDSRGREAARRAVADFESARLEGGGYTADHVVLTMGATQAIAALADFLLHGRSNGDAALCAIPNYPPLVQSIARRCAVRLVPTVSPCGGISLAALSQALTPSTPLVLLQTGTNPCGSLVDESELERFITTASPSTIIVLDECHEWLGAPRRLSPQRRRANVVRVSSLSKEWSVPGLKVGWFLADPTLTQSYYEHASTTYGGPASLMYTLVEVLARFERWRYEGLATAGAAEFGEFAGSYGLQVDALARAYESYVAQRGMREHALLDQRETARRALKRASIPVKAARCSINLLAEMPGFDDSYLAFRTLLRDTGVSLYPGVLTFRLAGGSLRVTTSGHRDDLHEGLQRLHRWLLART